VLRSKGLFWLMVPLAWAEQLPTVVFTARDGLPASTVPRIVVDSKGFVWFPFSEGLARFDGNDFRIWGPADGLPASGVSDLLERSDGTYWVAAGEQLCRLDPLGRGKRFQCESPKLGGIQTLLEDRQGLWCGTNQGLWRRTEAGAWEQVNAIQPSVPNRSIAVERLLQDSRGDVWAATYSGLYRLRVDGRVDRWTRAQGLLADSITTVAETPGAIWAGSQTELMRLQIDPHTGEARIANRYNRSDGLPSGYTTDVRFWRGAVWAATFQGLARQAPSGRWQAVDLDPSVRSLPAEALAIDALGHLWVGTMGAGAARISGSGFSSFSEREGLEVRKVWAVLEDRSGDLLALTKDEEHYALNRFDGYRFHSFQPNAPGGIAFGWSWSQIAVHSRAGDWWLATGEGLLRYRNGLRAAPIRLGPEAGLPRANIFRVFEDSGGTIWVARRAISAHALFRRPLGTERFESLGQSPGLPPLHQDANCPAVFAEDRTGQIWIGLLDGGLVRYRNGNFQQFPASSGAPSRGVRALLVDRRGWLWIGTRREGLLRIDNPSAEHPAFAAYTTANGLASNTVHALAEDLAGRIYAAGGSGIDRLNPATGRSRHFTAADGLLPGEFRVAFRDRRGALWFGGDQGLFRMEPQEDRTDPPVVLVHSIRVNGQSRPLSELGEAEPAPLSLSASQRQVQVDFGGFRHDLLYQTRLSGVDADWTAPSRSRSVHYLSLAPGSYELLIRGLTPEAIASARPARVRFRIATAVWQRWWFLLLSAAAIAGIGYGVHRYRLAQAVALERVRTRIAADLHDDIGSSLSHIAILSELAGQRVEPQQEAVRRPLAEIEQVSRELVDSISDIVWAIDPRRDHLRDLVQRMRRWASDVLTGRNIEFTFRAPPEDLALDAETRREVFLVFKEAVHNLVRHSGCTEASIDLRRDGDSLVLQVADNGKGLDPDPESQGQGLASMQRRAARLGGEARIRSNGPGACVSLRVPLRDRRRPLKATKRV
jgi:signal transduction histidine kinase/ligand-binding sensor domain-containing protein